MDPDDIARRLDLLTSAYNDHLARAMAAEALAGLTPAARKKLLGDAIAAIVPKLGERLWSAVSTRVGDELDAEAKRRERENQ